MASPTTNVTFTTDYGAFVVTLLPDAAPLSVANFLYYVENLTTGYNAEGSFFHRSVPGFVLQGGGYGVGGGAGVVIPTQAPVPSEASASRPNTAGAIAYATVSGDANSGTDQFFFNLVDNPSLNGGFTVFGSITSGFNVVQTIAALQVVNAGSPLTELPIDKGATAAAFNFARDVVDFRVSLNLGVTDTTPVRPFAQATISDAVATETVTITYAGFSNGVFSAPGVTGSAGYASFTGTPAQLTATLRALVFTPTLNEAPVGQSVATTFNVTIANGSSTRTDTSVSVTALSVNDAPVLTGAVDTAISAGASVRPFYALGVKDPDPGQAATVTVSFASGAGVLSGGGFTGANGAYQLAAASADGAQAALRAAVFTPAAGATGPTTLTVAVSDGIATSSASATVTAQASTTPANAPSVTSGFRQAETSNALRALVTGADAQTPDTPIFAQAQAARAIAAQLDAGQVTQAQAEVALAHVVDGTTSVAVASYAFFTGRTPSLAGLNYLVHSDANPTDLNDAYYAKFTTENRYINFAANLGVLGDGRAQFAADYGALDLRGATAKAYQAVFGVAADAAKVSALLDASVPDGLGGVYTRADYFARYGGDGINGQGTKAAMVGFLLSNAVATGSGVYGAADLHYVQALEHGAVPTGPTELAPAYVNAVSLVGTTAVTDPTISG